MGCIIVSLLNYG